MLEYSASIFGAITENLGCSGVLDPGLGAGYIADFVRLVQPVIGDWKIGWTTWLLCDRNALEEKIQILRNFGATVIAGGTAGEIAASRNEWKKYVELCSSLGFNRIEIAEGFLEEIHDPRYLVDLAFNYNLDVQYEIGRKNIDEDRSLSLDLRLSIVEKWLNAGVNFLVVEAREVGAGFAMFSEEGDVNRQFADELLMRCSLSQLIVETPNRPTYTAALHHFGPGVNLSNIPPNELLRVETMRRTLHADTIEYRKAWAK